MLGGNIRTMVHTRHGFRGIAASCAVVTVLGITAVPAGAENADNEGQADFRPDQWGLASIGATEMWEETEGGGIEVALAGPSVHEDHPDLRDNLTVDTGHGDNSGNTDLGTGMAGLIAGHGHGMDADGGVLGAAPSAGLLALPTGDDMDGAIRAAAADGAQVVVLAETDADLASATEAAVAAGAVVVGPADGGGDPNVLTVAPTDEDGQLAGNTADASEIDLTAPGDELYTAGPDMSETQVSGAPYAAALTAGGIALLRSAYPQLQPEQVRDAVLEGSQQGPGGVPALSLTDAQAEATGVAQDIPAIDEDLADEADQGSQIPVWVWFAVVGAVLLFGILALVMWVRRSTSDPYGVEAERREENEEIAASRAAEEQPTRRQKGGRRRKTRKG